MIACLEIPATPPLIPYRKLEGLGRINLISGKNNSGKSTLLRAIADDTRARVLEVRFELDAIDLLLKDILGRSPWAIRAGDEEIITATMRSVGAARPGYAWSVDDGAAREFSSVLVERLGQQLPLGMDYTQPRMAVEAGYREVFKHYSSSLLIPPRRRLDAVAKIDPKRSTYTDGRGILNALFLARNQTPKSPFAVNFERIHEAFVEVSGGYEFWIEPRESGELHLFFAKGGPRWDAAEECGLGLQDLLVILYFIVEGEGTRLCIEEPESHLHPDMQRRLLHFMEKTVEKQFFLTTHSNVFLADPGVSSVHLTTYDGAIHIENVTSTARVLSELGYVVTDNLVADFLLLVEGPSDGPAMLELLRKYDIGDANVKVWPLGGDIMGVLDLSVFAERYKIQAIVDNDPKSEKPRKDFIQACDALRIPALRLQRYAFENYFSLRALRQVFGSQIPGGIEAIDPNIKLEDQIGLNVKKKNFNLARETRLEEIADTDLGRALKNVAEALRGKR